MDKNEKKELHRRRMREEGKYKSNKRRRKKKKGISIWNTIILIVATCAFLFSGVQLFRIFSSYKAGNDEYKKIQDLAITEQKKESGEKKFKVDFAKLSEINPDVIGWIRFEEPSIINYPIVHSGDNREYLSKVFGEGKNTYGTIFVDKDNAGDFSDKNTFIYGHRMKTGAMFGKLEKYADESFYKEHPYFYIYTLDGKEVKYQIFSAGVVTATSKSYQKTFATDEEYKEYLDHIKSVSNYETDAVVTTDSQIVSLSTCTVESNENRFLVHAVKVSEE